MNITQCMTAIEEIYGKYDSDILYSLVAQYIRENWEESEFDSLMKRIVIRYSNQYKTPLDVAKLHDIKMEDAEFKAEKIWQYLINKSGTDDVMITDSYTYQVIAGHGSWAQFCRDRDNNREWAHKDFIKQYILIVKRGENVDPQILKGFINEAYGSGFNKRIRILGNEEDGKRLIEAQREQAKLASFVRAIDYSL